MASRLIRDLRANKAVYLMLVPVVAYYVIFCYVPMYGAQIAFKDYRPGLGILGSRWVGAKHFLAFFSGPYFGRLLGNTLSLSGASLLFGFPMPILLALLLNELRSPVFKKTVQTITYIPHFISLVVVCGMIKGFSNIDGVFNDVIALFGGERRPLLGDPNLFMPVYVASGIWQEIGWGSILYLAAIAGISPELYEAATIDGAGKLRQAWHITLSGIAPTITVLLILRLGRIMSVGYEKIILLYNSIVMEKADVISSYVYRKGLLDGNYSFATAVGLFNSGINFLFVVFANHLSGKVTDSSMW